MSLTCDINHRYNLYGNSVPGTTEVIRHFAPAYGAGDWYKVRGTAVHLAVSLALRNMLDYSSVDARILPRVKSILKFIDDAKLKIVEQEKMLASKVFGYAGTLDFIGESPEGLFLCDWKSSFDEAAFVQCGGYSRLARENGYNIGRAAAVICKDDGAYKAYWMNRRELDSQERLFLSFLTTWKWQKQNQLIKEE